MHLTDHRPFETADYADLNVNLIYFIRVIRGLKKVFQRHDSRLEHFAMVALHLIAISKIFSGVNTPWRAYS